MHWNVVKYWPPFMLAPFYMGAVTWDLFLYEQEQALVRPLLSTPPARAPCRLVVNLCFVLSPSSQLPPDI
eukprot:1230146-Rhodomonas_salina.4